MKAAVLERPCVHPVSPWVGGVLTLLPELLLSPGEGEGGKRLLEEMRCGASCREAPRDIDRATLDPGPCSTPAFNYGNNRTVW